MTCPNCNETLLMTERHNVEIDYCPKCRGVWLDRGELDKLLDQASQRSESHQSVTQGNTYDDRKDAQRYDKEEYERRDRYDDRGKYAPHGRKKKSFLSDFFDFD
ncbi:zf-TFIIB domain-containing protein [Sphingobacterium sp. DN00404]|uniref:Zf-TFIIB domain-containing protein n=1 Tax=Sphingobacterium micropteri TaxID=2763501 RepID=A0ABR7YUX1_9SPHI|nr:zf-TFIIB domain-containing protein [Sphingobacterium micropteri]MBD1434968.1 zf-TFIIB domain-containing protein [Sphingobacterium micropteri]